jgi:hypothetical protein
MTKRKWEIGVCILQRWQSEWVAISDAHKRVAIRDLCRPLDVHEDPLEAAATLKQEGYGPRISALDFCSKMEWTIHVFPWVARIRGLPHPFHIRGEPTKTFAASGGGHNPCRGQSFLLPKFVPFGDLPRGSLLETGFGHAELGEDYFDSSDGLIWMSAGWSGVDASVDHPGVLS